MNIQFNQDGNLVIEGNEIHPDVFQNEMTEYYPTPRTHIIDNLIDWISDARESDKSMMKDDLKMLMNETDDMCLQSISTNHYLFKSDPEFTDAVAEIIEADRDYRTNVNTTELSSESSPEKPQVDHMTKVLDDPEYYDFFTDSPSLGVGQWNDNLITIRDELGISNEDLPELENQLYIFSLLYDGQNKNPDWILLEMSKRIALTKEIYSSIDSLGADNFDENINTAISSNIADLRSKTMGLILKTNSGSEYEDGFTVTIMNYAGHMRGAEYVASLELYGSTEATDPYTNIKISSDYESDDTGYDRMLVLKAISMHEDRMVGYNPCAQLMDSDVLQPAIRILRKAGLITYYNDSFFLTEQGESYLNDRDFDAIRFPTITTTPRKSQSSVGTLSPKKQI